ncbi:hypothetical protein [Gymnodinialimonas ulvae]|uniref:hypothetical protein n=1 Tax=Gymnodinialimonas ulvae TaxID=3126504 RepID=UPI0030B531AC
MTVLVDEVYARILTEHNATSRDELSRAVTEIEHFGKEDPDLARRQSPMLNVLRAAVFSTGNP